MAQEKVTASLQDLETEYRQIYADFVRNHMTPYQEMAKRVLDLQTEIFKRKLANAGALDGVQANIKSLCLIASISARETVAALEQVLARLQEEQIKIALAIYDPRTFTFHLYSQTT